MEPLMRTVLVTGGTGFTGSHLVHALAADGHEVRVIARSAERAAARLPAGTDVIEGDVADPDVVRRAMAGREHVYHLAAAFREAGIPDSRYHDVHVEATRLLIEAARAEGVSRFVHCSTIGVHGHVTDPPANEDSPFAPGDIYQRTKLEGELLAREFGERHGFPVAVARPASIYGPGDLRLLKMFRMIAKRRFPVLGSGEVCFHLVHVKDLVRGLRLLTERDEAVGNVFILAGAAYRPLNDLFELVAESVGVPPPRLHLPAWPFFALGAVMEAVCVPLRVEPPIYRRRVAFYTKNRAFTTERANRLLGYEPIIDDRTGIGETADWYRANGYLPAR
jgi:nucleoside-diphosphate-sugar epimerase